MSHLVREIKKLENRDVIIMKIRDSLKLGLLQRSHYA